MKIVHLLVLLISYTSVWSQDYKAKTIDYNLDLGAPMKINLILAGNFCEMRSNHFHTGLDLKTQKVVGKKIYAIADGYIARIRVSPWGYGNALYLEHDNGLTSLYAHCQKFTPYLDSLVYKLQKNHEKAILDESVLDLKIHVKKGQFIGYSGTSGSSTAPHLHFEIRETETEHAINPLLFKCYQKLITDSKKPQIRGVKFYAITKNGYMLPDQSIYYPVTKKDNTLIINDNNPINIDQLITDNSVLGIGIHAFDQLDGAGNICGIYQVKLSKDNQLIHEQKTEYMNFDHNRFMNTHKDYDAYKKERKHIHKQFTTSINPLPIYPKNDGKIDWQDRNGEYLVEVFDAHQNKINLTFKISSSTNKSNQNYFDNVTNYYYPDSLNYILKDEFQVLFESASFYEPLEITYNSLPSNNSSILSRQYSFASPTIPLQKKLEIRIKCPLKCNTLPKDKLCLVYFDSKDRLHYIGGSFFDGWIEGESRNLGAYAISIDNTPPVITPFDYKNNKIVTKYSTLELKISDNLSGVKSYKAYINDHWVLMTYNNKKGKYIIPLNKYSKPFLIKGNNAIKIEVSDRKNNTSSKITTVIY